MFFEYIKLCSSNSSSQIYRYRTQLQQNGISSKLKTRWFRQIHSIDKTVFGEIEVRPPMVTYSLFVKKGMKSSHES